MKIGDIIRGKVEERKMYVTAFAKKINRKPATVYDIFERNKIDTQLLLTISQVLDFNFFEWISDNSGLPTKRKETIAGEEENEWKLKYYSLLEEMQKLQKDYIKLLNEKST